MDGHRKLLILALNELLSRKLISLDGHDEKSGYVIAELGGENTAITWFVLSDQELRISVWWKYDHSRHPQANLEGNAREKFITSSPVAKKQHYPKFVGVTVSGRLERKTGKHLQGTGHNRLFDIYTRRGEKAVLGEFPILFLTALRQKVRSCYRVLIRLSVATSYRFPVPLPSATRRLTIRPEAVA